MNDARPIGPWIFWVSRSPAPVTAWIMRARSRGAPARISKRTVSAKRRAVSTSSISPARSMASSSCTAISPLRVTRNTVVAVTFSPGNRRPAWAATRSSTRTKACSSLSPEISMRRPMLSGTGTSAWRVDCSSGSSSRQATTSWSAGTSGGSMPGSTASGVSKG